MALDCGAGGFEDPGFVEVEDAVAIRVAGDEGAGEVVGGVAGCAVVIDDAHVREWDIAKVRNLIRPNNRVANGDKRTGAGRVVRTVRQLDDRRLGF